MIALSIVSHGQIKLVRRLLSDLNNIFNNDFEVLLTLNIPELDEELEQYSFPIKILRNKNPVGFGANHNKAFYATSANYFAVVNPDIRITQLNLDRLKSAFSLSNNVGVVAPLVINPKGELEDSARKFPTISRIFSRVILRNRSPSYQFDKVPIEVDWVAGMFMLFSRSSYKMAHGFDDKRYFMYFEDVDICRRLNTMDWKIVLDPNEIIIHDAQRESHRNPKYFFLAFNQYD